MFPLPDALSFDEGAALPMNYLTAQFALAERGDLQAGETVLVHGAAGGVGTATIQVAKGYGARAIAVVSTEEKGEVARAAGADEVVLLDGFKDAVAALTGGRGVDVVVDVVGGDSFTDSLRSLGTQGRLLVVGFAAGQGIPEVRVNRLLLNNVDVRGVGWGAYAMVRPGLHAGAVAGAGADDRVGRGEAADRGDVRASRRWAGAGRHGPAQDPRQVGRAGALTGVRPRTPAVDHRVRFDWGPTGAAAVAEGADVAVVVDVLSFTTTLCVAVERGMTVLPYRWKDDRAATYAEQHSATLAVGRLEARSLPPAAAVSLSPAAMTRVSGIDRLVLPSPNGSSISFGLADLGARWSAPACATAPPWPGCLPGSRRRRSPWSPRASAGRTARCAPAPRTCGAPARSSPLLAATCHPRPAWPRTRSARSSRRWPPRSATAPVAASWPRSASPRTSTSPPRSTSVTSYRCWRRRVPTWSLIGTRSSTSDACVELDSDREVGPAERLELLDPGPMRS